MSVQQNFRSALNGFNREDVVRYIEYLNAKHAAEVNQLTSELELLRSKQEEQSAAFAIPVAEKETVDPVIEQQAGRIRELFDEKNKLVKQLEDAEAEKASLESQLSAALAEKLQAEEQLAAAQAEHAQTVASLESALQQKNSFTSRADEELAAYRRAERTERLARERAEQMYRQANGVIADATGKVDEVADQIGELTDRVMNQLAELQSAVTGSKQVLRDAAATMYTIHPETDEE